MLTPKQLYITIAGGAFGIATALLNFMPRSTFSERERRDLAEFPQFSFQKLMSGQFTDSISKWYSDSEPFRDFFLTTNENLQRSKGIHTEDEINFVADNENKNNIANELDRLEEPEEEEPEPAPALPDSTKSISADMQEKPEPQQDTLGKGYKEPSSGMILIGKEPNVRAMTGFSSSSAYVESYASAANTFKETFPDCNVWVMAIPTAIEFYCPEQAKSKVRSQKKIIDAMHQYLNDNVKAVDVWSVLNEHKDEDIYLRTDHHWSPLGGYYAAQKLAEMAGLPFKTIEEGYDVRVIHGFVGSMYGYTGDISVKRSAEDFVWYFPKNVDFQAYYIQYDLDKDYKIIHTSNEYKGKYFCTFKDGSTGAYCTFMGSDARITRVETGTKNGRRIVILKDSFGNTLPSCLFYSFEEVHVVDYRYFTKNLTQYIQEHKITDVLFANNMAFVPNPKIGRIYKRFLTQANGTGVHKPDENADSTNVSTPSADTQNTESQPSATAEQKSEPSAEQKSEPTADTKTEVPANGEANGNDSVE